ncbi:MAG: SpoIIE family protein phosphatase [Desulfamplus sp.]|nr:SpoIIE family protein phosphatase [Desulfamplus sp.]
MKRFHPRIGLTKSIGATLITKVFGIYFVLTLMITGIQLTVEYFHIKQTVLNDIRKMESTFKPGIAKGLWNMDISLLHPIIFGMNELSTVVGVKIEDNTGEEFCSMGVISSRGRQVFVTSEGDRFDADSNIPFNPRKGLFSHSFNIEYINPFDNLTYELGEVSIYSSAGVVIDRIKYGFFLIIVNSIIKTTALWFIIIYFVKTIIVRPLAVLTHATEKMNPNSSDFFNMTYSPEEQDMLSSNNELGNLTRSFDKMRIAILERIENLNRLKNVGEELASTLKISSVFKLIMETMEKKFSFDKGALFLCREGSFVRIADHFPPAEDPVKAEDQVKADDPVKAENPVKTKDPGKGEDPLKEEFEIKDPGMNRASFPGGDNHWDADTGSIGNTIIGNTIYYDTEGAVLHVPLTDDGDKAGLLCFSGARDFHLDEENLVFIEAAARLAMISIKNIKMLTMMEEHARLTREIDIARDIQSLLLPESPRISGYDICASCTPSEEVGGDYYDVISAGGYDWIVVGDVAGHGLPAGMVMMMVQASIRTVIFREPDLSPSELLASVNRTIHGNLQKMDDSKHMTIVVLAAGRYGLFSFSGLHEDIIVWRANTRKIETVETDGMWIGMLPDIDEMLFDGLVRLDTGDVMVLYTDGITESVCAGNDMFGDERLMDTVEKYGSGSAAEIHDAVLKELEGCRKSDDVTLLVIKRLNENR